MSFYDDMLAIRNELERARAAWTDYDLQMEFGNQGVVDLAELDTRAYVPVDIVEIDAEQMDLGPQPLATDYGRIIIAPGCKVGGGELQLVKLLDHFRPYLQLRDNIGGNVRTHVGKRQLPKTAMGFYYLPMTIDFWSTSLAPAVP